MQASKPELSSWLETNLLSSLVEDGFSRAVIHVPNMSYITAFTSLALARHADPNTLPRLLLFLNKKSSESHSSAASSSMRSASTQNTFSLSTESGSVLSDNQTYLKACCVAIALAQFDPIRLFSHYILIFKLLFAELSYFK